MRNMNVFQIQQEEAYSQRLQKKRNDKEKKSARRLKQ